MESFKKKRKRIVVESIDSKIARKKYELAKLCSSVDGISIRKAVAKVDMNHGIRMLQHSR